MPQSWLQLVQFSSNSFLHTPSPQRDGVGKHMAQSKAQLLQLSPYSGLHMPSPHHGTRGVLQVLAGQSAGHVTQLSA